MPAQPRAVERVIDPTPVIEGAGLISTAAVLALTMGGINSTIYLIPAQQ